MKKRLRSIGVLLMVAMLLSGCGGNEQTESPVLEQGQSDLQYVQEKGTLVVGITDYAPMDYQQDEDWTGFDVDLAKAFADSLGVT